MLWLLVEVKLNDLDVSKSLERLAGLLNCKKNRLDRRR
jgi:hypothetical protein